MTYEKTSVLAQTFGYCKRTMLQILHDMEEVEEYRDQVLPPYRPNGNYRANPEAVRNYLLGRRSK